jgi:hypothetical protein
VIIAPTIRSGIAINTRPGTTQSAKCYVEGETMKAKKHIEFGRVFAYISEGKTDILWFESEEVMRRVGQFMVELTKTDENTLQCDDLFVTKTYNTEGILVLITDFWHGQEIAFKNDKQMRRAGQCLIDLARTGGNEVEIKDKE